MAWEDRTPDQKKQARTEARRYKATDDNHTYDGRQQGQQDQQARRHLQGAQQGQEVSFAALLVATHGRPMERALIRARRRYAAAKPTRRHLSRIHRAYALKTRNR